MEIRNLETGEVTTTPASPLQPRRSSTDTSRARTEPTFVETADITALYTAATASPRPVHVMPVYAKPDRPVHVGADPVTTLKAYAWVAFGLVLFFVIVGCVSLVLTSR